MPPNHFRRVTHELAAAAGIALLAAIAAGCDRQSESEEALQIREFVERYANAGYWSGTVLVAREDSVVLAEGFGPADAEHGAPNELDTRFPVASVSKAFTALAVAGMREQGILTDSTLVSEHIPRFPHGDDILVGQLVEHRSGIPDIDELDWFATGQSRPHTLDALVDSLGAVPLDFEPGKRYSYSNGGYIVLAAVIEAASGRPFDAVLQEHVFEPAGMANSGNWAGGILPGRANGYTLDAAGGLTHAPLVHASNKIGAGSAYTTVQDMLAFHRSLRDGILGERARRDSLFTPIDSPFGRQRIYFGGRGPGYTASIQIFREDEILVVALGNNYSRLNEEITDGILGILLEGDHEARVDSILGRRLTFGAVDSGTESRSEFSGHYRHQWGFEFRVAVADGGLVYVDSEHGTRSPLIPLGDGVFISPWQWARIEFTAAPRDAGAQDATAEPAITWHWLDFPDDEWTVTRLSRSQGQG